MKTNIYDINIAYIDIYESNNFITKIEFKSTKTNNKNMSVNISKTIEQINEYFSGTRKNFSIPIIISGSAFEKAILTEIMNVGYGETISYSELALRAGYPKAIRAAASVCRKNKLPILIPCHRVIRRNGQHGKYAGGNDFKTTLIEHENKYKSV